MAFHDQAECARVFKILFKGVSGTMQNAHSSRWLLKGFLAVALVSCGNFVSAAEPEAKKVSAAASPAAVPLQGPVARVNGVSIDAIELRRAEKVMLRGTDGAG